MAGALYCWKCKNKVGMGFSSLQNAEIRYGWGFMLLKMLKYGTAGVLVHLKCWTNVLLGSYIVENAKIR